MRTIWCNSGNAADIQPNHREGLLTKTLGLYVECTVRYEKKKIVC